MHIIIRVYLSSVKNLALALLSESTSQKLSTKILDLIPPNDKKYSSIKSWAKTFRELAYLEDDEVPYLGDDVIFRSFLQTADEMRQLRDLVTLAFEKLKTGKNIKDAKAVEALIDRLNYLAKNWTDEVRSVSIYCENEEILQLSPDVFSKLEYSLYRFCLPPDNKYSPEVNYFLQQHQNMYPLAPVNHLDFYFKYSDPACQDTFLACI